MITEREVACDDLVLLTGLRASEYAEHLLGVVTSLSSKAGSAHVAIGIAHYSRLERRITSVLDTSRNRGVLTRPELLCVFLSLCFLCVPVAMVTTITGSEVKSTPEITAQDGRNESIQRTQIGQEKVDGICLDRLNNAITDARVALYHVDFRDNSQRLINETKTDQNGEFRFNQVTELAKDDEGNVRQSYWLVAQAEGRATAMSNLSKTGEFQKLLMAKAATLEGRVTDPDGNPIEGALVRFDHLLEPVEGVRNCRTDVAGMFRVTDLADYDVADHIKELDGGGRMVPTPAFRVEHPHFGAKRVKYERIPSTVNAVLEPAAVIEGRVVYGETGEPAAGVAAIKELGASVNKEACGPYYETVTQVDLRFRYTVDGKPLRSKPLVPQLTIDVAPRAFFT